MIIEKGLTKLPVDIKIDSDPLCKVITSRIWLYFRNGYEGNSEWMPLVLGDPPFSPPHLIRCRLKLQKQILKKSAILSVNFIGICESLRIMKSQNLSLLTP